MSKRVFSTRAGERGRKVVRRINPEVEVSRESHSKDCTFGLVKVKWRGELYKGTEG